MWAFSGPAPLIQLGGECVSEAESIRKEMSVFWGQGPGSEAQLGALAARLRALESDQLELLGASIPVGAPGSPVGIRCDRLRTLVAGIHKETPELRQARTPKPVPPPAAPAPPKTAKQEEARDGMQGQKRQEGKGRSGQVTPTKPAPKPRSWRKK